MAKSVFEQIKKQNGERFAKAIRGYDNGIFDIPGIVDIVKYAGSEAEPIMDYLESLKEVHIEETGAYEDPITLLDKAGYDAYYVTNLEEQNAIQKYYAKGEELCTFRDPHRFEKYHIVNAVRKDVDQIRREDFEGHEQREDKYGTSVLSIQILKEGGFISIKNRYNHTVDNPDNTLGSNPDRIILGLSNALRHHFGTDFSAQKATLPNGYTFINGQIIRYNYEQNNIYFGSNFYIKDGEVHHLKDHEIMMDSYIFDMRTKTLSYPDQENDSEADTAFKEAFLKEIEGHKVILKKDKDGQHLFIRKEGEKDPAKDVEILTVKDGAITALNLPTTTRIGDFFLMNNRELKSFSAPNLKKVGTHFLSSNDRLDTLDIPLLEEVKDDFLRTNRNLRSLNLPNLKTVGDNFLTLNYHLTEFSAPQLVHVGNAFLECNKDIKTLSLPELLEVGYGFLGNNEVLEKLEAPKLRAAHSDFLRENHGLRVLDLPAVEIIGNSALEANTDLHTLNVPNLKHLGAWSLSSNLGLRSVEFPALEEVQERILSDNRKLESFSAPKAKSVADSVLTRCGSLRELNLPMVEDIGERCFMETLGVPRVNLPMVRSIGDEFMSHSFFTVSFSAPCLESLGKSAFYPNEELETFYAPLLLERPRGLFPTHPNGDTLWNNREKLPPPEEQVAEAPKRDGMSAALRTAEAEKQAPADTPAAPPDPAKGMSAQLEPGANMGQGAAPAEQPEQNTSFFKRLRDWLLPHQ